MTNYAGITYNAKNPLRRFSHRTRFRKSIESIRVKENIRVLDYGCGDGLFLNRLKEACSNENYLLGYEPFLDAVAENSVRIVSEWESVVANVEKYGKFDYITCFEVLEHFSRERQVEAIEKILPILTDDGFFIVSVPVEIGFPSFIKNMLRRYNTKKDKAVYKARNIIASLFGKPLPEFRQRDGYLNHMGFYFTDLEQVFIPYFKIIRKTYSPFKYLGYNLNSQVFYNLKKLQK